MAGVAGKSGTPSCEDCGTSHNLLELVKSSGEQLRPSGDKVWLCRECVKAQEPRVKKSRPMSDEDRFYLPSQPVSRWDSHSDRWVHVLERRKQASAETVQPQQAVVVPVSSQSSSQSSTEVGMPSFPPPFVPSKGLANAVGTVPVSQHGVDIDGSGQVQEKYKGLEKKKVDKVHPQQVVAVPGSWKWTTTLGRPRVLPVYVPSGGMANAVKVGTVPQPEVDMGVINDTVDGHVTSGIAGDSTQAVLLAMAIGNQKSGNRVGMGLNMASFPGLAQTVAETKRVRHNKQLEVADLERRLKYTASSSNTVIPAFQEEREEELNSSAAWLRNQLVEQVRDHLCWQEQRFEAGLKQLQARTGVVTELVSDVDIPSAASESQTPSR